MGHHSCAAAVPAGSIEPLDAVAARLGAIVRADAGDASIAATLLTGHGVPVLTLNDGVVGTAAQEPLVLWAAETIAGGGSGFHIKRA